MRKCFLIILLLVFVTSYPGAFALDWPQNYSDNGTDVVIVSSDVLYEYGPLFVGETVVTALTVDDRGSDCLKCTTSNNDTLSFSIVAYFDKSDISDIQEGQSVIVVGSVDDFNSFSLFGSNKTVNLRNCHLVTEGITSQEIEALKNEQIQAVHNLDGQQSQEDSQPIENGEMASIEESSQPSEPEEKQIYYEDDKRINLFITRFNECNPDFPIKVGEYKKYYHHGREHDDQVLLYIDKFKIIISGGYKTEVYIGYTSSVNYTDDELCAMFKKFAKVYNPELSEGQLQSSWRKITGDNSSSISFDDFTCWVGRSTGNKILYFELEGKIE